MHTIYYVMTQIPPFDRNDLSITVSFKGAGAMRWLLRGDLRSHSTGNLFGDVCSNEVEVGPSQKTSPGMPIIL
ncbi:hypothetical protein KIN20_020401 [Parelaphostrongylus tenuis]|uniref:Uncharacterized protein n=1 Tax=Parelaphostrongylus tenuis TaxID=148309 RepID=A0AAD5N6H5_PARTN|nr:hypothetical protein KIN20_020401 [Parelaphostrongylus tenuis]